MKISQTAFILQSGHEYMVEMAMFNVQRTTTPKVGKPASWFMCTARCLIVLYICVKFRENITNGIIVIERIRVYGKNGYVRCSKGNNSICRSTRVTVHLFCTSLHGVLHCCEVS